MEIIEQIQEFIGGIPKPVLFAIVLLVLVGGFFLYKKMTSKDSEDEVEIGATQARNYAQNVASGLNGESQPLVEKEVVGAMANDEEEDDDSDLEDF